MSPHTWSFWNLNSIIVFFLNLVCRFQNRAPIPLANRAVHPVFLREWLRRGIPPPGTSNTNTGSAMNSDLNTEATASTAGGYLPQLPHSRLSSPSSKGSPSEARRTPSPVPYDHRQQQQQQQTSTALGPLTPVGMGDTQKRVLQGWTVTELINRYIKPATAIAHTSFVQVTDLVHTTDGVGWGVKGLV